MINYKYNFSIIFIFLLFNYIYCLPESLFLPVLPNYFMELNSDLSNSIMIKTKIELLPIDYNPDIICYYYLDINLILNNNNFFYSLKFKVDSNNNFYLDSISDSKKTREIYDNILVFPQYIDYNNIIKIGNNIYFKFSKFYSSYTINNKIYRNVISSQLIFNDITNYIYFEKNNGIIRIKTPFETFDKI